MTDKKQKEENGDKAERRGGVRGLGPSAADIERRINRQRAHLEQHLEQHMEQGIKHLERGQEHVRRHLEHTKRQAERGQEHVQRHLEQRRRQTERRMEQLEIRLERRQQQRDRKEREAERRRKRQAHEANHEQKPFYVILYGIGIALFLTLCWVGSYYTAEYVYTLTGWKPHALLGQMITSLLGIVYWGIMISLISRIPRKRQDDYFRQVIEALRRISRGDFQVDLNQLGGWFRNHPFNVLAKSVNEMAVNLKNTEEMRQEFISNVSHEIQSPLTSIAGFARVLKQEEMSREQSLHYLEIIERESARLSKLSDSMLRLASLDSKHLKLQTEPYRLDKQLQLHILSCEPQWLEKNLEMDAELEPADIEADQNMLSQVWVNLLHNAIKFTPAGGKVRVSLTLADGHALVSVKDTGIGISEEDLPHIFERFYKADRARTRTDGGNGLGLSILHKIVELHSGDVTVRSSTGEGTEFTVRLPLKQKES